MLYFQTYHSYLPEVGSKNLAQSLSIDILNETVSVNHDKFRDQFSSNRSVER